MSAVRISFFSEFQPPFSKFSFSGLVFEGVNPRLECCVVPVLLSTQALRLLAQDRALWNEESANTGNPQTFFVDGPHGAQWAINLA
jgi:hypothetical protein